MRIKIGNRWYVTHEDGPLMVELTDQDKSNIARMLPEATKYCEYQEEDFTPEQIFEWMGE